MSYDDNEVKLINTGSAFINDHKITLRSVVLLNGIFFVMSSIEALSFVDDDVTSLYWPDLNTTMLLAYDLKSSKYHSGYPIVSLIQEDEKRRQTLLNGFVSNFKYIGDRIAPSFLSDDILLLSTGASNLLQLNFSRSPRDLAEYEAGKLFSVNKKHQKLDQLIAKYTGKTLNGVVQTWKRSFGFLSCKGEASELGGIFLHIANVENKTETFFKKGVLVEFTIEYDKAHQNFQANWAKGLVANFKKSNYRGRGGGRGKGDHHTQGNCD